jgi:hypothetical protein
VNCREFENFLQRRGESSLAPEAREHLRSCPDCRRLFELLESGPAGEVDPAIVERAKQAIVPSLQPVRPAPSPAVQTVVLVMACAVIAWLGAQLSGFEGFFALSVVERVVIFTSLALFTWMGARVFASEMIPGSGLPIRPGWLLSVVCAAIACEFLFFFHDYDMGGFVPQGIECLVNGLLHAIPVGIVAWIVLRRGFAVEPVGAGVAAGILAGLGGVGLLELHCPNLKVMHQTIWHLAVLPLSGIVGGALGWFSQRVRGSNYIDAT